MRHRILITVPLAALLAVGAYAFDAWVNQVTILAPDFGGRLEFSPNGRYLYHDALSSTGYYRLYRSNSDGTGTVCLTCGALNNIHKNIGQPAVHPSGKWVAFQAQPPASNSKLGKPGQGVDNEIWVANSAFTVARKVVSIPIDGTHAILHPHFSPVDDYLAYSYRHGACYSTGCDWGLWEIRIADFRDWDGLPAVSNTRVYAPGGQQRFYETHGFTPDGRYLLFTANATNGQAGNVADIWIMEVRDNRGVWLSRTEAEATAHPLTADIGGWNEHSQIDPSGKWIVWSHCDRQIQRTADLWAMRLDGSGKRRLTRYNVPGTLEYQPGRFVSDGAWKAPGVYAALVQSDSDQTDQIIEFRISLPQ